MPTGWFQAKHALPSSWLRLQDLNKLNRSLLFGRGTSCLTERSSSRLRGKGADRELVLARQEFKNKALNIPLVFSSHRVDILPWFVVSLIPQHGPDHTDHVSAKGTNSLVVGLALCTLPVVVGL